MAKRGFIFSDPTRATRYYETAKGGWTLTAWELEEAEAITDYVDVPGRINGPLDLSNALTDGIPTYGNRQLSITLESSEGSRADRILEIKKLESLTGYNYSIVTPDYNDRHLMGRLVSVKTNYNDLAHAQVAMTFVCRPYYEAQMITRNLSAGSNLLANYGDRPAVPTVAVTGASGSVTLSVSDKQWALSNGTYTLPGLIVPPGDGRVGGLLNVTLTGTGTVTLEYVEGYL